MFERAKYGAQNRSLGTAEFDNATDVDMLNTRVHDSIDQESYNRKKTLLSPRGGPYLEVPQSTFKQKKHSLVTPIINESYKKRSLVRYNSRGDDNTSKASSAKKVYYPDTVARRKRKSPSITKSYSIKMDYYSKDDG